MNKFPIYSIIIPHHNIPNLLERCLKSIPTREDTEILIIDDNSDCSIVDFYNFPGEDRNDTRIFYTKAGKGGGYARNIGLKEAKGKWLLFADADDFFNPCFNDILNEYQFIPADIVFFNANSVFNNDLSPASRADHLNKIINNYTKNPQHYELQLRYLFGEPWCKMIKRSIVIENQIQFEETPIHNDTQFSYLIGFHSKKIQIDRRQLYCVTSRPNSVSRTINVEKIKIRIKVFSRANLFYKDHYIPVRWNWLYRQLADLKLNDKKLYKETFAITIAEGLPPLETRYKILKEIPKAFYRKFLK